MLVPMPRRIAYERLPTEQPASRRRALDRLPIAELLRAMNREDAAVPKAVASALPSITRAVTLIVSRLEHGGRLIFLGAGTSGRLGVIEAAECPPTFNTPPSLVQAIIAGGRGAVFRSREGAEDRGDEAARLIRSRLRKQDALVGIAASGVTPFVQKGLRAAKRLGAATVLVTCHPGLAKAAIADIIIAVPVGPEILTGSTRLKAGTATKLVLNMLTLSTMVQLGKVYDQWMVDVRPTSKKLTARAVRIISLLTSASTAHASRALQQADGRTKVAIVMAAQQINPAAAHSLLKAHRGRLRPLLGSRGA